MNSPSVDQTPEQPPTRGVGSSDSSAGLPGGYRCEKCRATGPYPLDDTTPRNAFRILFDSCPACDPDAEDSYRYVDASGRVLSILPNSSGETRRGE